MKNSTPSLINELLIVVKSITKFMKNPYTICMLSCSILIIYSISRTNKIVSKYEEINGKLLLEEYEILESNLDALKSKLNELELANDIVKLSSQQILWNELSLKNYSFNLRGGACFGGYEYKVEVKNGNSLLISDINGRLLSSDNFFQLYNYKPNIEGLFSIMNRILKSSKPDSYSIEYDKILGYPKSAFFDYKGCVLDEESCWELSDFKFNEEEIQYNLYYNDGLLAYYNGC